MLDQLVSNYSELVELVEFDETKLKTAIQFGDHDKIAIVGVRLPHLIVRLISEGQSVTPAAIKEWIDCSLSITRLIAMDRKRIRLFCAEQCNFANDRFETLVCSWAADLAPPGLLDDAPQGLAQSNYALARIFAEAHMNEQPELREIDEEISALIFPLVHESYQSDIDFTAATDALAPKLISPPANQFEDQRSESERFKRAQKSIAAQIAKSEAASLRLQARENEHSDALENFQESVESYEKLLTWYFQKTSDLTAALKQAMRDRESAIEHSDLSGRRVREAIAERDFFMQDADRLREALDAIRTSTSWRVTAPLRWLKSSKERTASND